MKTIILFFFMAITVICGAQNNLADSLQRLMKTETKDTSKVMLLVNLSRAYMYSRPDTALQLAQQALLSSQKILFVKGECASLNMIGNLFVAMGNYPKGLEVYLLGLKKAESIGDKAMITSITGNIASVYSAQGDYYKAIGFRYKAIALAKSIGSTQSIATGFTNLGDAYEKINILDSAKYYTEQGHAMSVQFKMRGLTGITLNNLGNIYSKMGNDTAAMRYYKSGLPYFVERRNDGGLCETYLGMDKLFQNAGNADSCIYYAKRSFEIAKQIGFTKEEMKASNFLTGYYSSLHNVDSAFAYQSAMIAAKDSMFSQEKQRQIQSLSFDEANRQQQIREARAEAKTQMKFNALFGGLFTLSLVAFSLYRNNRQKQKAHILLQKRKEEIDSKAHQLSVQKESLQQSYDNVEQLGKIGRKITSSLSLEKIMGTIYQNVNSFMDASIFGIGIHNEELNRIDFFATYEEGEALPFYYYSLDEQDRFAVTCFKEGREILLGDLDKDFMPHMQALLTPAAGKQAVSLIYLPLVVKEKVLGVITVQSFQQHAYSDYHLFMLRNIAIYTAIALENARSFEALRETNIRLNATQTQLIQSEKMASLGELTAGIAHEIQNPLNFVNNFSDLNTELLVEMKVEIDNGNTAEARAIADDVIGNEQKINHHGKRADAIVKGMLQHSRKSSGQKEPADINALAYEYLRLSYHGLRAKDKSFNATMKTDFDPLIGKANVVAQDMGRVLLNLFNNAFYAVEEKKRQQPDAYDPTIFVSTKKTDGHILIHVKDNGKGIPQDLVEKIFQPFFTTKPTGKGTGLGLSLSYDIIKAHEGKLEVESKEGE